MAKVKTLRKQKESSPKQPRLKIKKNAGVKEHDPFDYLLNEDNIARAILECLKNNDPEGVIEVIEIYINALSKSKSLKGTRVSMDQLLKEKNPTIKALAQLMHASCRV